MCWNAYSSYLIPGKNSNILGWVRAVVAVASPCCQTTTPSFLAASNH